MHPIFEINEWLDKEKLLGSINPDRVVLATANKHGIPHSRVVAIREVNEKGVLFFTQRDTRKVAELKENPVASMTLWLPMQQREVVLDGSVEVLTHEENQLYWNTMPHERQLRFAAYAPKSLKPIQSPGELENEFLRLSSQFADKPIPMSEFYCGFRLIPKSLYFYTLGNNKFSEVILYMRTEAGWRKEYLSP